MAPEQAEGWRESNCLRRQVRSVRVTALVCCLGQSLQTRMHAERTDGVDSIKENPLLAGM